MKKSMIKRLTAVVIIVTLAFSMTVPAFATENKDMTQPENACVNIDEHAADSDAPYSWCGCGSTNVSETYTGISDPLTGYRKYQLRCYECGNIWYEWFPW